MLSTALQLGTGSVQVTRMLQEVWIGHWTQVLLIVALITVEYCSVYTATTPKTRHFSDLRLVHRFSLP
jgi:choline-glycine betaine transporter